MAEITPLPNGGTWIIAEVVAPPIDELDPLPNGGTWIIAQADVEVKCGGGAYQFRRGRRAHIAGATGVSIQGR